MLAAIYGLLRIFVLSYRGVSLPPCRWIWNGEGEGEKAENGTGMKKEEEIFYDKVLETMRRHTLLHPEEKVLVALSGGADSVALLLVLLQMSFRCEAVHCNFHLRGEESDRDERFVRNLCRNLSVRLHVEEFDTASYAREKGISIEMAAREQRYACFEKLRIDLRLRTIAVAHHRDDNVETLLLNLVRGTGLKGLTGMRYRQGHIIRPLLDVSRAEVEAYLEARGQLYVTDRTNLETEALRNKVRLEVLPLLRQINPSVSGTLQATIGRLDDAYVLYAAAVEELKRRIVRDNRIAVADLRSAPAARTLLFELLSDYGFNAAQATDVYDHLDGESGKVYESAGWRLLRDRGTLVLRRKDEPYACLCSVLPLDGFVQVTPDCAFLIRRVRCGAGFAIPKTCDTVCMDIAKLDYPISVRFAAEGDRFVPFGMKGEKLVSDYLTDRKRNLFEKERQLVVCSGERIAWLVNERADERFRVDEDTTHALIIQCRPHRTA